MEIPEDKVDVERAFVGLINDEGVILTKIRIVPGFREKNPVGHELHRSRLFISPVFEADLITDLFPQ